MQYENLHQLIGDSSSARQYFLSLPSGMQVVLHELNASIHTAQELRQMVRAVETIQKMNALGGWSGGPF